MGIDKHIIEPLRRWLMQPHAELSRTQRTLRWWVDLGRHCAHELRHDRAGQMAAALTYHTLFSLLPTVVLMLVVMGSFVGPEQRDQFKETVVEWLLKPIQHDRAVLTEIDALADPNASPAEARPETANPDALAAAERQREFERARQTIRDVVNGLLEQLEGINLKGIGAVGVLIFIWGATGLLATIEKSFNIVYGVAKARPWYLRLPLYYTVITVGPVLVVGGQILQARFIETIRAGELTNWLSAPMVVLTPLITIWIVLSLMYLLLPNTRVSIRGSLAGGFVGAAGWMIAIEGLKIFIRNTAMSGVYGALFLLPLFLLWVWITWLIVLFGLELCYAIHAMKGRRFKHLQYKQAGELMIDATWLLPLIAQIGRRFEQGKPATEEELARMMDLPARAIQRMAGALERAGLVHKVDHDDNKAVGYSLARPAAQITAADVLDVGENLLPESAGVGAESAWQLVDRVKQQWHDDARNTTLDQLLHTA